MIAITPMLIALGLPVKCLEFLIAVNPIVSRFTAIGNAAADMALTYSTLGNSRLAWARST